MSKVEKFGKYLLLEKIAVGGMAEVYLTKSSGANGVNKFVAIKRILPQFSSNPEFISMFKEEAKVAINLSHSNIVSIYDFGIENNQFYIVMEFVDGRNLRQIINEMKKLNKTFSIDQAVHIIKEAAAGLNHAHRCTDSQSGKPLNITHRDMSPQNIMVSFEGETKVIDFGIAKAENENEATKAGTLKGKFSYMSPEQSEGYPIDPRTDVFALGIILWELLANDRLFTGSNEGAILRKVRECQIPPIRKINPLVPQELERIVMKALAKDKNVRYQTAANFHKDLNLFLNTQYPDFSTHDFSLFIRDSFKSAYSEGREKLIAFSKVEAPTNTIVPAMNETVTSHKVVPAPAPVKPTAPPVMAKPEIEELKGVRTDNNEKIVLDGVRGATVHKKPIGGAGVSPQTYVLQNSRVTQKKNSGSSDFKDVLSKMALIFIITVVGFMGYKNYFASPTKKASVAKNKNQPVIDQDAGAIDMAATASTSLSISSEPTGAKIYIDGVDTNQYTPGIVTVTANKPVTVVLMKDGYYKYQTAKTYAAASVLSATLSRAPDMGYVNIYIVGGGDNTAISINGVRLKEKLPIENYAVPANSDIEIKAENNFLGLQAKTRVKVMANKTETVQLVLTTEKK